MAEQESAKLRAARAAAALIRPGMTLGLGSGTTAALFIEALGDRVRLEGLADVSGAPTSEDAAELAREVGIRLIDLDSVPMLDLDVDGADEVDSHFRMIKGRGGALLREKIVAAASRRRAIIITPSKRVDRLGQGAPVPVEVTAFGIRHTERALQSLGAMTTPRLEPDGSPFVTDEGHRILDCHFAGGIDDPEALDRSLKAIIGVFETGIFLGLCDVLIVGHEDRLETFEKPVSL
jgi:ribose 5-phosphate isomerase A